jgi:hypothetical protein
MTVRELWLCAGMNATMCLGLGFVITRVVAWMIAWFDDERNGSQTVAWPQAVPSMWLVQRIDGAGTTVLRWSFDDEWSRHVEDRSKSIERARRRGDAKQLAREERRFDEERSALLAERVALAPVKPSIVPRWSSRIEILSRPREFESSAEAAFGWPFRAFAHGEIIRMSIHDASNPSFVPGANGWLDATSLQAGRSAVMLPLRPIWAGLTLDSVLYSVPLLALAWFRRRASGRGGAVASVRVVRPHPPSPPHQARAVPEVRV